MNVFEALCSHIAIKDGGTSSKKQQKLPESQFSKLLKKTLDFYIHMYAVQDRSIYFNLFPNIYIHFLFKAADQQILFSWFPSVYQSASRIQPLISLILALH